MQKECFLSDRVPEGWKQFIRSAVCRDLPVNLEHEGEKYCLLHFPSYYEKPGFQELLDERLNEVYEKPFVEIVEQTTITHPIDFTGVWFPRISFRNRVFDKPVCFNFATFTMVDFGNCEFIVNPQFRSANFIESAGFDSCKFKSCIDSSEADFSNAIFDGITSFSSTIFNCGVSFSSTKFNSQVTFAQVKFNSQDLSKRVSFYKTKFQGETGFWSTNFASAVNFDYAIFAGKTIFESVNFNSFASFSQCHFKENSLTTFEATKFFDAANFQSVRIQGRVVIDGSRESKVFGDGVRLDMQNFVVLDNGVFMFKSVILRPNWFINCEAQSIHFVDVDWTDNVDGRILIESELRELTRQNFQGRIRPLFVITCRQLTENAENNNRFEEASKFRRMAFECERLERKDKISNWWNESVSCLSIFNKIIEKAKTFPYDFFHWVYRWTSGYGENRLWAFFVLFLIVFISTILYSTPLCEFPNGQDGIRSLDFFESVAYSLRAMVLQRPEPFPTNTFGKIVLALETVFAPLQAALLALAIRRKFMR